jgi:RimJ/RimL family protein N-acetyltransferase
VTCSGGSRAQEATTVIPLPADEYPAVLPFVRQSEAKSHMALVHTLLEGRQRGIIFVDRVARPETVLVCPVSGFCFLFGDVRRGCFERFLPRLLAEHLPDQAAVFATSAAWRETLDGLLIRKITRIGFEFHPAATNSPVAAEPLPSGFALEPLDATVMEKWSRGIDPWVIRIWGGPESFAASVFGMAVMTEGRIVSFCTACAIGGGEAEAEVGTVPELRGRGLATRAARAFIAQCREHGLRPAWNCVAGNAASAALARRLGFVELEELPGYLLDRGYTLANGRWGPPPG